jgi:hypothetical protein
MPTKVEVIPIDTACSGPSPLLCVCCLKALVTNKVVKSAILTVQYPRFATLFFFFFSVLTSDTACTEHRRPNNNWWGRKSFRKALAMNAAAVFANGSRGRQFAEAKNSGSLIPFMSAAGLAIPGLWMRRDDLGRRPVRVWQR